MDAEESRERLASGSLPGPALLQIALGLIGADVGTIFGAAGETDRSGVRILSSDLFEAWLLRWPSASSVTPHDHGNSTAALAVAQGELREVRWSGGIHRARTLSAGEGLVVEQGQVHDVIGVSPGAVSVHVYSPPLSTMAFYDDEGGSVVYEEVVDASQERFGAGGVAESAVSGADRVLAEARRRIAPRAQPEDLDFATGRGALVIDTRPAGLRDRDGTIPGAIPIERNVLEWRLDPTGAHRIEGVSDPDRPVIVVCDEGYASSLAAASLLDLGRRNVTDLEGGFQAWRRQNERPLAGSNGKRR